MSDFEKCVKRECLSGRFSIGCIYGLWAVSGADKRQVESEAMHYWQQYNSDGEYYQILGGESPGDKLFKLINSEVG